MSNFVNNNVSAYGDNNMKINLNLKVKKSGEIAVPFFCKTSDYAPGFCLVLIRDILVTL